MTVVRRTALLAAALLASGSLLLPGSAVADTPYLSYRCTLPVIGASTFPIKLGTNAPARLKAGRSVTPTLTTWVQVPQDMANLMSKQLGARKVEGSIVATVKVNSTTRTVVQKITPKAIPATSTAPLPVVALGKLPKVTARKTGAVVYRPGNLKITLKFSKANGTSAGQFSNLPCSMPRTTAIVDKITFRK